MQFQNFSKINKSGSLPFILNQNLTNYKLNSLNSRLQQLFFYKDNITGRKYRFKKEKKKLTQQPCQLILNPLQQKQNKNKNIQLDLVYQKWQDYLKIKKFHLQCIMSSYNKKNPYQSQQQVQDKRKIISKKQKKIKDQLTKNIYKLNKKYLNQYLNNKERFNDKIRIVGKLDYRNCSFKQTMQFMQYIKKFSQGKMKDLEKINKTLKGLKKITQQEKINEIRMSQEIKAYQVHKYKQQDQYFDALSNKIFNKVKLNLQINRKFNGQYLIQPTLNESKKISIEKLINTSTEYKNQINKQLEINFVKQIMNGKSIEQVEEDLKNKVIQVHNQLSLNPKLTYQEKNLVETIKKNDWLEIIHIISKRPQLMHLRDQWDNTVLHYAAKNSDEKLFFELLKNVGRQEALAVNKLKQTPAKLSKNFRNQTVLGILQKRSLIR